MLEHDAVEMQREQRIMSEWQVTKRFSEYRVPFMHASHEGSAVKRILGLLLVLGKALILHGQYLE